MNPLGIADLLRMAEEDKQAAIAEAEARGYARGCRDLINEVAKWHNDVPSTGELIAGGLRYWLSERTANVAPATGHASNAAAE